MKTNVSLQLQLLEHLQAELGEHINVRQWLMDELGFKRTTSFRIMSDERKLDLEECFQIFLLQPKVFARISDSFAFKDRIMIRVNNFQCEESFQKYLQGIIKIFDKAMAVEDCKLLYTARDLPIFYFLAMPRLLEFKYAYWNHYLLDKGPKPLSSETHQLAREVYQRYLAVPSVELWHPYAYLQQVHLLQQARMEGSVNEEQFETINRDLNDLLSSLKSQVMAAEKPTGASLTILHAKEHSMDNAGILQNKDGKLLMSALPIARFFSSTHPELVENYLHTFNQHSRSAVSITDQGQSGRLAWFNNLQGPDQSEFLNFQIPTSDSLNINQSA